MVDEEALVRRVCCSWLWSEDEAAAGEDMADERVMAAGGAGGGGGAGADITAAGEGVEMVIC